MSGVNFRRILVTAVIALLGVACAAGALNAARELHGASIELRWNSPIDTRAFDKALEGCEYAVEGVIWERNADTTCDGAHLKTLDAAVYYGDSRLLTGGTSAASTCGLSYDAGYALFGSKDARGASIMVDRQRYTVSGMFEHSVADVLLRWNGVSAQEFNGMSLTFPGQNRGVWRQRALDFATMAGMPEPDYILDAPLLAELCDMAACLPAAALAVWMLAVQLGALSKTAGIKRRLIGVGVLAATALAALLILNRSVEPARWLLPTRWSDFSFWQDKFSEIAARLDDFISAGHFEIESAWLYTMLRCIVLSVAGTHLLLIFGGSIKRIATRIYESGYRE